MPSLTIKTPDGKSRSVTLLKRITSLGKSADHTEIYRHLANQLGH